MQNKIQVLIMTLVLLLVMSACGGKQEPVKEESQKELPLLQDQNVRQPLGIGTYYPKSSKTLQRVIKEYVEKAKKGEKNGTVRMIIAPSAPLTYSGEIAADAYAQIKGGEYKRAVIISAGETQQVGVIVPEQEVYETPLGKVKVDREIVDNIKNMTLIHMGNDTTVRTEIQLVFLQSILENFTVLPLLIERMSTQQLNELSELIEELADEKTLVVVSTVLSSGKSYLKTYRQDAKCLTAINRLELTNAATECEASARLGLLAALAAAKRMELEPEMIAYATSGDTVGNKDRVTGYAAVVFREAKENVH